MPQPHLPAAWILFVLCVSVLPAWGQIDRAHQLAAQAASQTAVHCGTVFRPRRLPSEPPNRLHARAAAAL